MGLQGVVGYYTVTHMNTAARTNKFAAKCTTCGTHVPAGAGSLGGKVNGRWVTRCATHTPAAAPRRGRACDCHRPNCGGCDDTFDAMRDAR